MPLAVDSSKDVESENLKSEPNDSSPSTVPTVRGIASWPWYARYFHDPLTFFVKAEKQFGPILALGNPLPFRQGGRKFVVASGSTYNKIIFGQPDEFRSGGQTLRGPKGSAHRRIREGIIAMNGEKHRAHRRVMKPPLLKPAVATYGPRLLALVDDMIDDWKDGSEVDIHREMHKLANWASAHLLFGSEDFSVSIQLGEAIEHWLTLDADVRSRLALVNLPGTRYRRLLKQAEVVESLMLKAIERNRNAEVPGVDMLSLLIRASDDDDNSMTQEDLVAHAVILYAASFETTANALAWTLFLIAQHPSTAKKLHDEISNQLGSEPPDIKSIDKLPHLDATIKESLRLLPPVAFTFRTTYHKATIDGLKLSGGDKVVPCHYLTHRNPDIFPEPNRFNPERWFSIRPGHYDYVPFSAGPRVCLGISFAQLELKMTIARIIQRFRFTVVPDSKIDVIIQLTLRPKHGIPMTVHTQDQAFSAAPIKGNITKMVDL